MVFESDFDEGKMAQGSKWAGGKSAAPSVSEVTTIEYNRWMVEEDKKKEAEGRKQKHDAERAYRKEQTDTYVKVGHEHSMEYKEQMETAKREVDNFHKSNLEKGTIVKAEVSALNSQKKKHAEQWIEHGSTLAHDLGSEQKRRIKKELGATSTRKREQSKALKSEMTELEKMRTEGRNQAVENRKALREQIAQQTSDAVTQEAKDTFFQQRKEKGEDTRAAMKDWKEERVKQQGQHLDKAAQARAEALNAKRQAKEAIEALKTQRAQVAKEMRERRANINTAGGNVKTELSHNKKVIHDLTKRQKFVQQEQAANMKSKLTPEQYAHSTRSKPAVTGSPTS